MVNVMLTSSGLVYQDVITKVKNNLVKPLSLTKMLVIPCGIDNYNIAKAMQEYIDLGFLRENITVFDYEDPKKYRKLDIDLIYVCGGNTFLLARRLMECGFYKEIKKYVENGVVYLGAGAGSVIAGRNIEHQLYYEDNKANCDGFKGIKLIDGIIMCHYDDTRKELYRKLKLSRDYPIYTLREKEVIYIDDGHLFVI